MHLKTAFVSAVMGLIALAAWAGTPQGGVPVRQNQERSDEAPRVEATVQRDGTSWTLDYELDWDAVAAVVVDGRNAGRRAGAPGRL